MSTRTRFNVLVVRADGRGITRLSVPRWSTRVAATVVVVGTLVNVALVTDYARVRRDRGAMIASRDLEQRLTELRDEIVGCGAARWAVQKSLVHEHRSYHAGSFIVTVGKQDHQHALGADLAPTWTSRSHC